MDTQVTNSYSILNLVFISVLISLLNAEPIVKVSDGLLNGTQYVSIGGRYFSAFLGIPFSEIPIGPLRFSNPVPKIPWRGIRSANKEANMCSQISNSGKVVGNEDCLYLNVYSPVLNFSSSMVSNTFNGNLLPVMVWIHGGSFLTGSSGPSKFCPKYLLNKDIILVSMNYRLGILGFLSTGDSVAPGNFGLKDQVLALKWTQQNIHIFGGDKKRITIFGESAGGACVNFHAISDASDGLFNQYIIQSGSVLAPWTYQPRSHFKPYINQVAKKVGCSMNNSTDVIKCFRKTSFDKLLTALKFQRIDFPALYWMPTDEPKSEEAFLTDSPENLVKQNKMKNYPVMSGNVLDEGLIVTQPFYRNPKSKVTSHVIENILNLTADRYPLPENEQKFKTLVKDYYFNGKNDSFCPDKLREDLTKFIDDSGFIYPQIAVLEKLAEMSKNPVYHYLFAFRGQKKRKNKTFGVPHGDDVLYIFPKIPPKYLTKEDNYIIYLMIDLWTSFAINGKPTSGQLANPNIWQPFGKNRSYLEIGNIINNTDPSEIFIRRITTQEISCQKIFVNV